VIPAVGLIVSVPFTLGGDGALKVESVSLDEADVVFPCVLLYVGDPWMPGWRRLTHSFISLKEAQAWNGHLPRW